MVRMSNHTPQFYIDVITYHWSNSDSRLANLGKKESILQTDIC